MTAKTYNSARVTVSFAGIALSGYMDGDFLQITPEGPRYTDAQGADGEYCYNETNESRVTVTISLMASSASNDDMSALHNRDLASVNGAGVGALEVRDLNGTSVDNVPFLRIVGIPDRTRGREIGTVAWVLRGVDHTATVGGSNTVASAQ